MAGEPSDEEVQNGQNLDETMPPGPLEVIRSQREPWIRQVQTLESDIKEMIQQQKDWIEINARTTILRRINEKIKTLDEEFWVENVNDPLDKDEEKQELAKQTTLQVDMETIMDRVESLKPKEPVPSSSSSNGDAGSHLQQLMESYRPPLKLPEVQITKFDGDIKKFRNFWGQFSRVHESKISKSEKFGFLVQHLEPGSEAYEIVSVYDIDENNYDHAVGALREWYGNTEKQRQLTMKELLKLVIAQSATEPKLPLRRLRFKVESYINSLEALEIEKADPRSWLVQMVESCLPKPILLNWKKAEAKRDDQQASMGSDQLKRLMKFIKRETDVAHDVEISQSSYVESKGKVDHQNPRDLPRHTRPFKRHGPATANFHVGSSRHCYFCDRDNHNSEVCFTAAKWSMEKKKRALREKKRCYNCTGNHFAYKCKDVKCPNPGCGGDHIAIMCPNKEDQPIPYKRPRQDEVRRESKVTTTCSSVIYSSEVVLQTLLAKIRNGRKEKVVRFFFDTGAMKSYMLRSTADELDLEELQQLEETQVLMGDQVTPPIHHTLFKAEIAALNGEFAMNVAIRDQKKICSKLPKVKRNSALERELCEKGITLTDTGNCSAEIEVLIGADLYNSLMTGKTVQLSTGAKAYETWLGWTVLGPANCGNQDSLSRWSINMALTETCLTRLWDLESLGIKDPIETESASDREKKMKEEFLRTVTRDSDGRYVVKLPWKRGHPPLPRNREAAMERLVSTANSLKEKGMFEKYCEIFREWENEGYIEQMAVHMEGMHYISHRDVLKPSSTTPVRPVFNASFRRGKNVSLNDCLEKGPSYIQLILEGMFRFRRGRNGLVSDIRRAYQQIKVCMADREFMRFLMYALTGEIIEYRHCTVFFGAICSAFILGAVLELHLGSFRGDREKMAKRLFEAFYVDNCVDSVDTVEEYRQYREESVGLMNEARMELRGWYSSLEEFSDPNTVVMPVLGMQWDRKRDELFVSVPELEMDKDITKRTVLSFVQQIFDPMGIVAPAVLPMKFLLQRAWMRNKKWDEPLEIEDRKAFLKWGSDVKALENVRIPRMATGGVSDTRNWSLHVFSDASGKAYGSVVFLRTELDGEVSVQMLVCKTRLAPIPKQTPTEKKNGIPPKPVSIARLELMGCLLSARLCQAVKKAMRLESVREVYYTDSAVALAWINRIDDWGIFVDNRTTEIRKATPKDSWKHVPGVSNPADDVSRGCSPKRLLQSKWWEGPDWLYSPEEQWPLSSETPNEEEISKELVKTPAVVDFSVLSFQSVVEIRSKKKYHHETLVRIVGWMRRFLNNAKIKKENKAQRKCGELLDVKELEEAEIRLLFQIQQTFLKIPAKGFQTLKTMRDTSDCYVGNRRLGLLRVKTKLTNLPGAFNFKFPIVLPGHAPETQQLIMDTHWDNYHAGVGFLMTHLRQKYWILRARQTIRRVIATCRGCSRFTAKPVVTIEAPLPLDRIQSAEVFENIGVDLGGPLHLKGSRENREIKVWFVLFTCAVYRAVHIEVVSNLTTTAFLEALELFVRRYRRPDIIYADNGTNFRGADRLCETLDWDEIKQHESVNQIRWKFIPPASPWHGGFWERLIRTTKDLLRRTVGNASLYRKELERVLLGIAEVMNKRPLTYVSEDPEDLEPLTPAHFLHPLGSISFPEKKLTVAEDLRYRYNYVQTVKKELQDRFNKEYLSLLVHRNTPNPTRDLEVGELVFIGHDQQKRLDWKLGKVVQLIESPDGAKRRAFVRTANEGVLERSVQRLYPLEAEVTAESNILRTKANVSRFGRLIKIPQRLGQAGPNGSLP